MRIAVTGSIATDHLLTFPGRFGEQLIEGELDKVSLSFLADELDVRRGGVAANIAFGLGALGLRPLLVGSVGRDFAEYGRLLAAHGVDTGSVHVSETRHTARFICTTDADQNQIGTFYAGAMSEARHIALAPVRDRAGGLDLVLVSPNDPEAMLRHTREAAALGVAFSADPSQQLARLGRDEVRLLLRGPRHLFTNAYEAQLVQERTGWTERQVLERVGTWVITRGADGVRILASGRPAVDVAAVPADGPVEPTGAGDAFRAGFLAATARADDPVRAARLGAALATTALESVGPQAYTLDGAPLLARIADAYGPEAAADLEPEVKAVRPAETAVGAEPS
ncbi:kinase [Streptomyces tanashiensis]|uniref:Putative carbohydrate kinase n=1 Tax=Streptomyces sp. AM-7161 TaxID=221710 RepID=Q7WT20_9ACTN|nr:carbohydrate kinase family protein [Streptomyces tanashiensis]BAC79034.1 putative carbohydrate kinase [Streptomyces sp. AM-7161]GGT24298.1 kinase [Streptomyces tanashiensis]